MRKLCTSKINAAVPKMDHNSLCGILSGLPEELLLPIPRLSGLASELATRAYGRSIPTDTEQPVVRFIF
jgi:hypothetical protein